MDKDKKKPGKAKKFLKRLVDKLNKPVIKINEKGPLKSVKKLRDEQNRILKELK